MKVLLWSPGGCSDSYHGPGSFMFRMYGKRTDGLLDLHLSHSVRGHPDSKVVSSSAMLGQYGGYHLPIYLKRSERWLSRNAKDFDIMHAIGGYHVTVAPAGHAQQLGLPVVLFVTSDGSEFSDKGGVKRLTSLPRRRREILRRLECVIAMSSAVWNRLIELGVDPKRIARIPMGVDLDRFQQVPHFAKKEAKIAVGLDDRPVVLFVGALVRRKQPHLALKAMAKILAKHIDAQLVLVGPSPDPSYALELDQLAKSKQLGGSIIRVPFTSEVERYYAAADVFVLPSRQEGMPAAMAEAMASGVPCVGTPISGIEDMLIDGTAGRIVPSDADALANAILDYLQDSSMARTHGTRLRNSAMRSFDVRRVLDAHVNAFEAVLAGSDPSLASLISTERGIA